ncbi:AbrB/MazE/SpoVT family DNA-binding domain-containing protein [Thermaerobacter litoralis]
MITLARVGPRGLVTIPAAMRQALGIQPGDTLLFTADGPDGGRFTVIRTSRPLAEFFARHQVEGPVPASLEEQVAEDIACDVVSDS